MAIPNSGPLSMSMFRTEWGAPTPTPLSWFRGKSGLPSSGPISFSQFYGKSNITVNMPDLNLSGVELGGSAAVSLNLQTNGQYTTLQAGTPGPTGTYVTPTASATSLEVRATVTNAPSAGAVWSGAGFGTWLPLSTARGWALTLSSAGLDTGGFNLEFRIAGQTTVIDTASIAMTVQQGAPP